MVDFSKTDNRFIQQLPWDYNPAEKEKYLRNLAPIVLFTYKRLEHLEQTVAALKANHYAGNSELFVFSDGARSEDDREAVEAVRGFVKGIDGFKGVHLIERSENWGLARNIVDGVTAIINRYKKIIVLEDDIVTSPFFLKYMNDALFLYENTPKVMEIAGYMLPMYTAGLPDTFFSGEPSSWGWATWARSWKFYKREPEATRRSFSPEEIYHFCLEGYTDYWFQVLANCQGSLNTWAVFWSAAVFKQKGLVLEPRESLVKNIGMDGSGEHCAGQAHLTSTASDRAVSYFPLTIAENMEVRERKKAFEKARNPALPFMHLELKLHI